MSNYNKNDYIKGISTKPKKVAQLSLYDNSVIKVFNSVHEAAKKTGIDRHSISRAAHGDYGRAGYYKWRFV